MFYMYYVPNFNTYEMKVASEEYLFESKILVPISGIQGQDIGDVKFNQDGDAMGRYSVYQYQQVENTHDPKGKKRLFRVRYVRNAHTDRVYVQKPTSWTKSRHKSSEFSSLLFTVTSTALP
jgi:hypothetical protein